MINKELLSNDKFELENAEKIIRLWAKLEPLITDDNPELGTDRNSKIDANEGEVDALSFKIYELATPAMNQFDYLLRLIDHETYQNRKGLISPSADLQKEVRKLYVTSPVWYELFKKYQSKFVLFRDYLEFVDDCLNYDHNSVEYKFMKAYCTCKIDDVYPSTYVAMYY